MATNVLAYPFRPFFLLCASYAVILLLGWLGLLFLGWPVTGEISPLRWHAHEILFGLIPAAIAGFLLTAIANWTGRPALRGRGLMVLVGLWVIARLAMWLTHSMPAAVVVTLDVGFLAALTGYCASVIIASGSFRNLVMVAVLLALTLACALSHAGFWREDAALALYAQLAGVYLVMLLIVLIGGRIIPNFSGNWLAQQGRDRRVVRSHSGLDAVAIISIVALAISELAGHALTTSSLALIAAIANTLRLLGWSGWHCWGNPLLWVLHLGYAWIIVALLLRSLAVSLAAVPDVAWLHAAGVGAMGTMLLGVMTRVALGHTGRALVLPPGGIWIYALITAAAVLRVGSALTLLDDRWALAVAGIAWIGAFGLFLVLYWGILTEPRPDGRPG